MQDKAAWPLGRVLGDLARTIAHDLGQPEPDLGTEPETAFRQAWLPAILGGLPEGSALVLLLDEFDVLATPESGQAGAAFFPYLRKLISGDPQKLKFVFAIGQNVHDLSNIAYSLLKSIPCQLVSLLDQEDTVNIVRLSEKNRTLIWSDEAVERVWQLTNGHPLMTQQLCSEVWENTYDQRPQTPPTITKANVDTAVTTALVHGCEQAMEWLWDGLPRDARIMASVLAQASSYPISRDRLNGLLQESGFHAIAKPESVVESLQEWDLIRPTEEGYHFRVEMLRQWISKNKPLRRVQEELDRIERVAEGFYQAASGFYEHDNLDQAIVPLRQAIEQYPGHIKANTLLAEILQIRG